MNRLLFVVPVLTVLAIVFFSKYTEVTVSGRDDSIETSFSAAVRGGAYICGVFGDWEYRFPKAIVGPVAEYVGDNPWGGAFPDNQRGCADKLRDLIFRICMPEYRLIDFDITTEKSCFLKGSISISSNDIYLEEIVAARRAYRLMPDALDVYDEALALHYYDIRVVETERIFWKSRGAGSAYVFGRCSIDALFPQCRFETYSSKLGASIGVGFAMKHLGKWQSYFSSLESELERYQYKRIKDRRI